GRCQSQPGATAFLSSPLSGSVDNLMIVLTINSGSASVKLAIHEVAAAKKPVCLFSERHDADARPRPVLQALLAKLASPPDEVAHRVVHGGTYFTGPTRIDDATIRRLEQLNDLAPLHNPKALQWLAAARTVCGPPAVHVAHFDTAFFAGLPRVAAEYALPAD